MSDKEIESESELHPTVINGIHLLSGLKLKIAAEGNIGEGGEFAGVGWDDHDKLLIEYDKRGGLMAREEESTDEDGNPTKILAKIKNGAFWDYKKRAPRTKPVIELQVPPKARQKVTMEAVGKAEKLPTDHESVKPLKKSKKVSDDE